MSPSRSASDATNLVVFGRGLNTDADGNVLGLSAASIARVDAALRYVADRAELFRACRARGATGRVVFSGGWPGAAAGLPPPPAELREGRLMCELACARGIPDAGSPAGADLVEMLAETESASTLENAICVRDGGYLADRTLGPAEPLGLVAHAEHLPRIDYLVRKVFGLPADGVRHIVADGVDGRSRGLSEVTLHRLTRFACVGASTPASLRRRQRLLLAATRPLRWLALGR